MNDVLFGERAASTLEAFGRHPWRKLPPVETARLLLDRLDPSRARKMSRFGQTLARRARSRRHFDYWAQVDAALAQRLDSARAGA